MTDTAHDHVERRADLPTGIALPYVDSGPHDAPPVVLLHGFSDNWRSFLPVLPYLEGRVRAISVTQRGHGDASKPSGPYDPASMAADVIGLLDALGISRAHLAGHSMGSAVALQAAVAGPSASPASSSAPRTPSPRTPHMRTRRRRCEPSSRPSARSGTGYPAPWWRRSRSRRVRTIFPPTSSTPWSSSRSACPRASGGRSSTA